MGTNHLLTNQCATDKQMQKVTLFYSGTLLSVQNMGLLYPIYPVHRAHKLHNVKNKVITVPAYNNVSDRQAVGSGVEKCVYNTFLKAH